MILLRGAAASVTAYNDPALQHCHDVSLLVAPRNLARGAPDIVLQHESTLPVELHTRPLRGATGTISRRRMRGDGIHRASVGDRTVPVLALTDAAPYLRACAVLAKPRDDAMDLRPVAHPAAQSPTSIGRC